jgi:acetyl-CoA carboxylase biotin carboxylase subunit
LFIPPGGKGIRFDSHAYSGYVIPPYYDSMIGKLIIHSKDRKSAIEICRRALEEFIVEGIHTTIPFTQFLVNSKDFNAGMYNTGYIEQIIKEGHFEKT